MIHSMTAFASGKGAHAGHGWSWELRGVNGKGLDLRLRVPDWIDGLEMGLRTRLNAVLGRGNVTLGLRVSSAETTGRLALSQATLDDVLHAMSQVEEKAMQMGLSLAPATSADVLALRGVLEGGSGDADTSALRVALLTDFETVLQEFVTMRASEGAALAQVLGAHLDEIARLTDEARALLATRAEDIARSHRAALARVVDNTESVDPARVAQELAVLAVKLDVTEELDRLGAHVAASRALIEAGSPVGRKIDFLSQEFNREANTLCSKAQHAGLTEIGLGLKTVIDQMREQVQNVE
ncbi:YicC/YloC family endoribonuclease [uncultured Roseovarius sp.]|uniref:YicC/YloC family endoribonuclease n=1 Tax=uncultured Roseovarius sp. TaxID=293344 RepID=UPI00262E97C8|nr:YicC/YloC family endoribonuclease [uncultured Roseovarius sp.]